MAWDYDRSQGRAQKRWDSTAELTVSDVVRAIDFDNIALLAPKRLRASHVYAEVANFNSLLRSEGMTQQEGVRLLHIWQRESSRVASGLEATKVHYQGPRLHAVAYRPVSDDSLMAAKAVLLGSAYKHSLAVFNDVLLPDAPWKAAVGIDHGRVTVTKNGSSGDRELLFLGPAANHAAHLVPPSGIRISAKVADLLPSTFDSSLRSSGENYTIHLSAESAAEMIADYGWTWELEEVRERLEDAAIKYPTSSVAISATRGRVDKNGLYLSNTKRMTATSIFADIDGFTAQIDAAVGDDPDLIEAVRTFHVIRGEGRDTAGREFDAMRIQYQGDRMQALSYLPTTDEAQRALNAITLASALTSVANEVVPSVVPEGAAKPFAIGLATGEVLLTRIGEHGNRDLIVVGASVALAAAIQGRLDGGQIGLDRETWLLLPEWVQTLFAWSSQAVAYVASGLTYDVLMSDAPSESSRASVVAALSAALVEGGGAEAAPAHTRPLVPQQQGRPWLMP